MLSLADGFLGGATVYLLYDGYAASTLDSRSLSQVGFEFTVTGQLLLTGLAHALLLGFAGALAPAVRAARANLATALRSG